MKVRYVGNSLEGVIVPDIGNLFIALGEVVEVADDAGANLLDQPENWESADEAEPEQVPAETPAETGGDQ